MSGTLSADKAKKQFDEIIRKIEVVSHQCFKDMVLELLRVGPEEQNRRFEERRQQSLRETQERDRQILEMRVEAAQRMGCDASKIDHDALNLASGVG